ncbi:hypothetical protein LXL04_004645 [Taraxacum kok-saghyz]
MGGIVKSPCSLNKIGQIYPSKRNRDFISFAQEQPSLSNHHTSSPSLLPRFSAAFTLKPSHFISFTQEQRHLPSRLHQCRRRPHPLSFLLPKSVQVSFKVLKKSSSCCCYNRIFTGALLSFYRIQLQHKFWQPNVQHDSITAQFNYNGIQLQQNSITFLSITTNQTGPWSLGFILIYRNLIRLSNGNEIAVVYL